MHCRTNCLALFLVGITCLLLQCSHCDAKEIELTKEWQVVGNNDTLPAGAHIRMDMTTGEKWAKLMDEADDEQGVEVKYSGQVSSTAAAVVADADPTDTNDKNNDESPKDSSYDYDMMHRTLSNLPPEEQQRMGGLPELPGTSGSATVSPKEREMFEKRMLEIWQKRQAELASLQEQLMVDMPEVLKDRIKWIRDYLEDPYSGLVKMNRGSGGNNNNNNDDQEEFQVHDIQSALADLEYQLGDVDMTRDFHTLGGWPLLVSLLHDGSHACPNQTVTPQLQESIGVVQSHAAWAVGTAVKNTGEFYPFAVEPVTVTRGGGETTTALDLLLQQFHNENDDGLLKPVLQKRQKMLYAIGSLLRGNRVAQEHFLGLDGPSILTKHLPEYCQDPSGGVKLAKKVLALVDDVVSDVTRQEQPEKDLLSRGIMDAFATEGVCHAALGCLDSDAAKETALRTIHTLSPHCQWEVKPAVASLQRAKDHWRVQEMDQEIARELIDLATSAQDRIKSTATH